MRLEGVHHVTAITADAPRNVDFYAGTLGLRLVKKTVNQDDPTVYHLFYADERGDPGSDITFFEYPGARQGRAGAGMVHTVQWRLATEDAGDVWEARGEHRGSTYRYNAPPQSPGIGGAGTVHHVAWASPPEEHERWRERVAEAGANVTPIIDRFYFKSIYFREPSGVLFEIATIGPGFTADEPFETLGERLSLPPNYEQYREQVEKILAPLPNPRADRARTSG